MSEESGPFTEYATKADRGPAGSKAGWVAAGVMVLLAVAGALLWASTQGRLRSSLDQAKASLTNSLADLQQAKDRIAALQTQAANLAKEKEQAGQAAKGLENEMRSDLESRDVTISNLQGKLTVNILDRVMFDSGEAVLQPDGEAVLRKIAAILAGHPEPENPRHRAHRQRAHPHPVFQQLGAFHRSRPGCRAFSYRKGGG